MTQDFGYRIIVVDDDTGVRDSLEALLTAKGYACELFDSAEAFLQRSDASDPAIILIDYSMGAMSGLHAIKQLRDLGDTRPIIMVTAYGDIALAVEAMRAGASDFIEKPWDKDALFEAIDRVAERARSAADSAKGRQRALAAIESLTPREKDVFDQLITGASNKLVARALDLSPRTVEFYRANVLEKTGATNVAELVRLAFVSNGMEL